MELIKTVPPEEAEGIIKEGYDMFMEKAGIIPKPMEMMSASPGLFELSLKRIQYFSTHPRLGFALLVHIRYLVAHRLDYQFCTDFNAFILKKIGVDDDTFKNMKEDPSACLLEENEKAVLVFVMKAIKDPGSVIAEDIRNLKDLGWKESDIVDALVQGVNGLYAVGQHLYAGRAVLIGEHVPCLKEMGVTRQHGEIVHQLLSILRSRDDDQNRPAKLFMKKSEEQGFGGAAQAGDLYLALAILNSLEDFSERGCLLSDFFDLFDGHD